MIYHKFDVRMYMGRCLPAQIFETQVHDVMCTSTLTGSCAISRV